MITKNKETKFWIITDTHLIANSLHDNGQTFSQMQKTSQGKDLYYQEIALEAFVKMANEKKPAAIVVCGDITFNGARVSAQKFAEIFADLKETKLLVLPGNHDIYDGWAREFRGDKQFYAGQISPRMWKNIFKDSYQDTISCDNSSLAYSVQLNPDYFLICLDSNYYSNQESDTAPATAGRIGEEQLAWLKKQLEWGREQHLNPIIFMHHNLYAHNKVINKNYVVDDALELRKLCQEYDVKLIFSGHIHAQHIMGPQGSTPTAEIVTSSFCTTDQGYGIVSVTPTELDYHRESFEMAPYLSETEKQDWTLTHFHNYLETLQLASIATKLVQDEFKNDQTKLKIIRKMGHIFGQINYDFFVGKNHITKDQLQELYSSPAYKKLITDYPGYEGYLASLYDTSEHSNLKIKIEY